LWRNATSTRNVLEAPATLIDVVVAAAAAIQLATRGSALAYKLDELSAP
jgi:hypothetical protein